MLTDIATKSQQNIIMTDQIFLQNLTFPARIGVFDHEKQAPQHIVLNIELNIDTRMAAQTDNLSDTLDYAQLATQLAEHSLNQHIALVETLAQQLADICLLDQRVQRVRLSLSKPHALTNATHVGVIIEREQNQ